MRASETLENMQLGRKTWNLTSSWRNVWDRTSEEDGKIDTLGVILSSDAIETWYILNAIDTWYSQCYHINVCSLFPVHKVLVELLAVFHMLLILISISDKYQ